MDKSDRIGHNNIHCSLTLYSLATFTFTKSIVTLSDLINTLHCILTFEVIRKTRQLELSAPEVLCRRSRLIKGFPRISRATSLTFCSLFDRRYNSIS
ncbi:hypothetical protein Hdeb2414_s0026g00681291 [Helianthus debilis subsp. tardiflorus]